MGFGESAAKAMKGYADSQKERHERASDRASSMSGEQLWEAAKRDPSMGGRTAYQKELKKRGY